MSLLFFSKTALKTHYSFTRNKETHVVLYFHVHFTANNVLWHCR